jgi:hypothetical protein
MFRGPNLTKTIILDSSGSVPYSYRSDSMGSSRDALTAG